MPSEKFHLYRVEVIKETMIELYTNDSDYRRFIRHKEIFDFTAVRNGNAVRVDLSPCHTIGV